MLSGKDLWDLLQRGTPEKIYMIWQESLVSLNYHPPIVIALIKDLLDLFHGFDNKTLVKHSRGLAEITLQLFSGKKKISLEDNTIGKILNNVKNGKIAKSLKIKAEVLPRVLSLSWINEGSW